VDDAARIVRELNAEGKAPATITSILNAGSRVFKFARRRMGWHGESPISNLESGERPKTAPTQKPRVFRGRELPETIAAAHEQYKTLFAFAATTGARQSECLGLVWGDLDLADLEAASVSFAFQVDRSGQRQELKTEESRRTLELPPSLARLLAEHQARSPHSRDGDFVYCTASGRAISQRNASRELKRAMRKARRQEGGPTFPSLHAVDKRGRPVPVPARSLPSFHSFRHTAASEAIKDGESAEEVSWQLGHRNSNVTRSVYVQEIRDVERTAARRAKYEARIGSILQVADLNNPKRTAADD
jgi:integrase